MLPVGPSSHSQCDDSQRYGPRPKLSQYVGQLSHQTQEIHSVTTIHGEGGRRRGRQFNVGKRQGAHIRESKLAKRAISTHGLPQHHAYRRVGTPAAIALTKCAKEGGQTNNSWARQSRGRTTLCGSRSGRTTHHVQAHIAPRAVSRGPGGTKQRRLTRMARARLAQHPVQKTGPPHSQPPR